ncbi:MAG: hypothetical protein AAFO94_21330, partial [Bacteroidota bacterium]
MRTVLRCLTFIFFISLSLNACKKGTTDLLNCDPSANLLSSYTDPDGNDIQIYDNGALYLSNDGECAYTLEYFDPNFFDASYVQTDDAIFLKVDEQTLFEAHRQFRIDFENISDFRQMFIESATQRDRLFNAITLQSPSTPTTSEYIALRKCLLDGSCDFIDNRFDLAADPTDADNQVLQFYSVAPSDDMVTAKSSITSGLIFFESGDDFWMEARFYVQGVRPTTLADFESGHFEGSPGPRIIFKGDQVAIENKFGAKRTYRQPEGSAVAFPT